MSRPRGWFWPRLRGLLPRSRLLRIGLVLVPLLLVLMVAEPVFGLLAMIVSGVTALLRPLLEDPFGRLGLVVSGFSALLWVGAHVFRDRLRTFRASLLLRRHLDGIAALVRDDPARSRRLLEGVARARGPLPPEFPLLREDACLKLARLALRAKAPARAQAWLLRVREAELPPSLARSWAQLRAQVEIAAAGALPESVGRVVRESLARFPEDVVLLRLLRDLHAANAAFGEAAAVQERVARLSADPQERTRLTSLWLAAADRAFAAGDESATEAHLAAAHTADRALAEHSLLPGHLRERLGDVRGALRHWGRVPGSRGLASAMRLLASDPHALTPREVLEVCPTKGGVLLVATSYAMRGDLRAAMRAARIAGRALPASPTAAVVIVDTLRRGNAPDAGAFAAEACARFTDAV